MTTTEEVVLLCAYLPGNPYSILRDFLAEVQPKWGVIIAAPSLLRGGWDVVLTTNHDPSAGHFGFPRRTSAGIEYSALHVDNLYATVANLVHQQERAVRTMDALRAEGLL